MTLVTVRKAEVVSFGCVDAVPKHDRRRQNQRADNKTERDGARYESGEVGDEPNYEEDNCRGKHPVASTFAHGNKASDRGSLDHDWVVVG